MNSKIRVGVVDDHPLYRDGVIFTLAAQPDFEVVGQGASAADALRIATEQQPDVLVLDMTMPGGGMNAVEAIAQHHPMVRTLMLTVVADEEQVCSALKRGARGYLLKGTSGPELVQTVRLISQGESYVSPSLAAKLLMRSGTPPAREEKRPDRFSDLTPREEQILSILVEGRSNKEIGNKLDLSEKTIKHHLTNILQKLQVRNRVEAALLASDRLSQRSTATAELRR
ncbi:MULTISPECIES: LuxR C-terminal-related transcriptional regulator [Microvirga]|uniref:LuxR C-terminal-related transcriptional regulator n=1 Tax=Microvirga TaxID=186650 RepID=UPI001CFEDD79|nr:response regulator transcription factor [Microvirga lenta]MCB5174240.1 response regulator transcription factor [Microvirga lenta]